MRWEWISRLPSDEFRWLTGVKKETFLELLKVLETVRKASMWGRDFKLKIEDVLLMALIIHS